MKNIFKITTAILLFLFLTNTAFACSLAIPTISIDSVISDAELAVLEGECLDLECNYRLIRNEYDYYDNGYMIVSSDESETQIASISPGFNSIELYSYIDKELLLETGVTSLFEALDKLTPYDLTEDQSAIEELIEEYLTTSWTNVFEEFHFDIISNEKLTASKEESIRNSNNSKSCYDIALQKYSNFHTLSSEDKGICVVNPGDGASCPRYIYPEVGFQTFFGDRSSILFMGVIVTCVCLIAVGVLAIGFVIVKKKKHNK